MIETQEQPRRFKPAPGCLVRKLDGSPVVEDGEELPSHPYYARLVADGDLVPAGDAAATGGLAE